MPDKYLKISQLARLLNDTLELYVGESFFEGELQEITRASSGHLYCTIKDELSALSIVLWASSARQLKFTPERGLLVRCQGRPSLYPKTGRLQVVVSKMELAGEGALAQKFEELKKKLSNEGLFSQERKRPIPFLPKAIGLITSQQGAVVHDIMTRLRDRMPNIPVYLLDVRVQGEGAPQEIAAAIKYFSDSDLVDVIICGRGGGSLQDLWSFNEELVVRAIFGSRIPIISAVGHEVDITLADLVADVRAPTPTAAAEIVVPKREELFRILAEIQRRLSDYPRWLMPKMQELDESYASLARAIQRQAEGLRLRFEVVTGRLRLLSPHRLVELEISKLSKLQARMQAALTLRLERSKSETDRLGSKLDPARRLDALTLQREKLERVRVQLGSLISNSLENRKNRMLNFSSKLQALNPSSILQRGYSITRQDGKVLSSVENAKLGQDLAIQLRDGTISAQVK